MIGFKGFGSALRAAYRPLGVVVADAFDFLTASDEPDLTTVPSTADAITRMRLAARHLSDLSETVIARSSPTARQVINEATDEAADFHA